MKKKFDVKNLIATAISQDSVNISGELDLKIMDFAFSVPPSNEDSGPRDSEESWRIFLVVSSPQLLESKTMFVVQLLLMGGETRIMSTHAVDIRSIPATQDEPKPKILVSKSEDTAFILIGHSLIVLSLSTMEETPSSQLLLDSQKIPMPFQDIIHLRSGCEYEVLGYGSEDRSEDKNATFLMMIRGFGVIRVNVIPQCPRDNDMEEGQVTAKHKLEQAIFFGTMAKNPLNLIGDGGLDFPASEIEQASLEICRELLRSESRFIPSTAISVEQNLRLRAKALNDLASLLAQRSNPLRRPARWELLWGAEKLAAQRAMWKLEESQRASNEDLLLSQVIESMNDKFKTRSESSQGEVDPVRQWFLKDTYQMEHIIPWIKSALKHRRGNSSKQARKLSEQILEASEIFLAIMETAFRYRDEHAALYGLSDDFVENGVLADGYEGLPEFWTSREMGYTEAGHLLDLELDSCRAWSQQKTATADAPEAHVLKKIADNSARHLGVLGQMHRERTRWLDAQSDPKLVDASVSIEQAHVKERKWQLFKLAGIGHLQDALSLAERFRDMGALVELIIELQDEVKTQPAHDAVGAGGNAVIDHEADVVHRISQYFDKFGEPWADAYFARQISMGHPGALLSMRKYQASVTRFLRKTPSYSKLSWINDVAGEDDYESAASCLEKLALGSEKKLWNHRVEISLAKLGKLASFEKSLRPSSSALHEDIKCLDDYSEIDEIQDTLYSYVKPVLEGAIDRKAETELALDYFGGQIVDDRPSLHEILGDALSTLVNRNVIDADDLIDLLTLMGPLQPSDDWDSEFRGREFFQALRVLDHSRYAQQDPSYVSALRKLIWRRCLIKDNWAARGKVAEESNGDSDIAARDTALAHTLTSCLAGKTLS
jgi:nuclear pore complex protein Nup133